MENMGEKYGHSVHHLLDSAKGVESLKTTKDVPGNSRPNTPSWSSTGVRQLQLTPEIVKLYRATLNRYLQERRAEVLAEPAKAGSNTHGDHHLRYQDTALRR